MKMMNRLFGQINMKWKYVILSAVIIGIYTGVINQMSFLENTSFRDIAITYEWWVVFAVIIVVNCQKPSEAAIKCFVFFLISQPIVFLVEAPTVSLAWSLPNYYFRIWLPMTILTLPGGYVAYYCKKQNIVGSIVLGLGNTIMAALGVYYSLTTISNFPRHLLSALFCFTAVIIMTLSIQKNTRNRIICLTVSTILTGAIFAYAVINNLSIT